MKKPNNWDKISAPKKKFAVYVQRKGDGKVYANVEPIFVGETYAKSKEQAINNVRYRREGEMPNSWTIGDCIDDSAFAITYYSAVEI